MCKCEQGLHWGSSAQRRGHFQGSKTCLVRVCAGDGHWDSHTDTHTHQGFGTAQVTLQGFQTVVEVKA